MSEKNEQTKILEEEVVVNENTTELVEVDKEAKKAKFVKVAKKVGKIAGIASIGIIGFLLGRSSASNSEYDDSDIIDVECETNESDAE